LFLILNAYGTLEILYANQWLAGAEFPAPRKHLLSKVPVHKPLISLILRLGGWSWKDVAWRRYFRGPWSIVFKAENRVHKASCGAETPKIGGSPMVEKRGRRAAADFESGPIFPLELPDARPEPPPNLSPRAAEAWRAAVSVMPAGHFSRERWPVLKGYCQHVAAAHDIWPQYHAALKDGTDPKLLLRLSKMHSRERDAIRHASRHLGLLQVMRYGKRVPKYQARPWELDRSRDHGCRASRCRRAGSRAHSA
jgi:hypothetical protein